MSEPFERILGRLEAKVDTLLEEGRAHARQHSETEQRIRSLEQDLAKTKTMGSIAAFVVTTAAAVLPSFWSK